MPPIESVTRRGASSYWSSWEVMEGFWSKSMTFAAAISFWRLVEASSIAIGLGIRVRGGAG